jgi:nucleoid-associated protein YgaU
VGDMVDAVDRRIGPIPGRVGAARVRVGADGRRLPGTAGPIAGLNALGGTTTPRAHPIRGRAAAASAASAAKCGSVDRAAQWGIPHSNASPAHAMWTGSVRLKHGFRSGVARPGGQSAVKASAVVVTRKRAHLTRRGQLVLVALAAVVVLAVAGLMSRTSGTATQRPEPIGQHSIVVQPGQTLWSIAKDVAPDRDVREVIYEIRRINGLDSAMVRSGQTLVLPAG